MRNLVAVAALALGGCGFHLRAAENLPFDTLFVSTPATSALGAELRRTIRIGTSTRIVDTAEAAAAVLDVSGETTQREVVSYNAQGQAREYELRYRLAIRVHDGKGYEYLPTTPLQAVRDIAYNDSQVLAKESEEALLFRDMRSDLVQQVLRRLGAIKPRASQG